MRLRPRDLAIAIAAGGLAMIATLLIGAALTDDGDQVDGSFVLTEPGDFVEPETSSIAGELTSTGLVDAEGRPVDLSIFRGGPLVINVWYSTCAPCEAELRDFADVQRQLADTVAFVGIDPVDNVDGMEAFASERGVEYDLWLDPERVWVDSHQIVSFPTTLLVSPDGTIVRTMGAASAEELLDAIAEEFDIRPE